METIKDLVSVIIPTYNRAGLITRSAKSVLNQTYKNLELIIVDDGSTDNTEEVVKSLDDERIIYIKQKNQGACVARNNGIDHAKGEFIAFQDSDDVWHEDKLERQIKCLKETGADLTFCCMNKIEEGKKAGLIGNNFKEGFLASSELPFGGSTQTLCACSEVFKNVQFDDKMPRLQDFELLLRVQKKYKIYYKNEPLIDYYVQENSISKNPQKLLVACNRIMETHTDFIQNKPLVNFILYSVFLSNDKDFQHNILNLIISNNPSFDTKLRIFTYKLGILQWYQRLRYGKND